MKTVCKITFAFLVLNFASEAALAASYYYTPEDRCTPVDFRRTFPLKMRNQNKVSWCFAHAASDYLQYAYQLNEQVSAADVAINYSQSSVGRLMHFFQSLGGVRLPAQTGFIKIAVSKIIPQGYCPESALPSDEWNRTDANGTESKKEIRQSIVETLTLRKMVADGEVTSPDELPAYFTFKNIDRDRFFRILKNSSASKLMNNIRLAACRNERKPFGSQYTGSDFQIRGSRIFQNMNASFDEGMPVTIDFFSDVFRNYDHPKKNINDLHTVLVYGRKYNPKSGQCEYMIKDSYGEQCTKYDPKIACEGGYVWLPESKLFRAMTSQLILYH